MEIISNAIHINFNPRSREGSDPPFSGFAGSTQYFNPRSREGSDKIFTRPRRQPEYFNPRSREGSDW